MGGWHENGVIDGVIGVDGDGGVGSGRWGHRWVAQERSYRLGHEG